EGRRPEADQRRAHSFPRLRETAEKVERQASARPGASEGWSEPFETQDRLAHTGKKGATGFSREARLRHDWKVEVVHCPPRAHGIHQRESRQPQVVFGTAFDFCLFLVLHFRAEELLLLGEGVELIAGGRLRGRRTGRLSGWAPQR